MQFTQLLISGLLAIFITACGGSSSDDADPQESSTKSFDSLSLPGTYDITFTDEQGVHRYVFDVNGSVQINWHDGEVDNESWAVNVDGQLIFSGSIADIFTLISGSQADGGMNVIIDDNDGSPIINTTGTIVLVADTNTDVIPFDASTLSGTFEVTFDNENGVNSYVFNSNGSVSITWHDGVTDNESWQVDSDGKLVFSGSIADIFTLTSGTQTDGVMNVVIDDNDGSAITNTTGTMIKVSD